LTVAYKHALARSDALHIVWDTSGASSSERRARAERLADWHLKMVNWYRDAASHLWLPVLPGAPSPPE
jgi:hypothetical protein